MQENNQTRAIVECENLVKIYKTKDSEVLALQGLELNIDRGEVIVDGKINGLFYTGDGSEKHGFWGRLFS